MNNRKRMILTLINPLMELCGEAWVYGLKPVEPTKNKKQEQTPEEREQKLKKAQEKRERKAKKKLEMKARRENG